MSLSSGDRELKAQELRLLQRQTVGTVAAGQMVVTGGVVMIGKVHLVLVEVQGHLLLGHLPGMPVEHFVLCFIAGSFLGVLLVLFPVYVYALSL